MKVNVHKIGTLTGHNGSVYSLDKGTQDNFVFSASGDKFVALWNLNSMQPEKFAAQFPSSLYTICHIPEKQLLIVGTASGSIHILDLIKKEEIKILQHHTEPIFSIRYSLKTNSIYSAGGDGNFAVCSLDSLSLIKIKKLCSEKVRSIDFNYTSFEIAVACGDCSIRIFDLQTLNEKKSFKAHEQSVYIVKFSPDDRILLSGGKDAHLKIWDTTTYTCIKSIPAHNFAIYDIVYSPVKKLFATASRDKTIKIWDANTFNLLVRINNENYQGHINSVNKLLWINYNNYLLSASDDRSIMVWEIAYIN